MIKSFSCKETRKLFGRTFSKKLPESIQKAAYRKLVMLDAAIELTDLKIPPSNHLEKLCNDRAGQHSIRINKQWRICFNWNSGAEHVEIVDYH